MKKMVQKESSFVKVNNIDSKDIYFHGEEKKNTLDSWWIIQSHARFFLVNRDQPIKLD